MNCTSLPSVSWVIVMLVSQDLGCCFPIGDNQNQGAADLQVWSKVEVPQLSSSTSVLIRKFAICEGAVALP
ncbi:hypothetical protein PVAP13_5KG066507 [Panicum virgatum]|uniref:Secreted protein n=1 Tax=Panicum virgatum TaxID=38727 RepID=A0A8T0SPH9_PANVG|nr:hypothetical protein PVAP13_5KG066507 [Panicum virgatum]